MVLRGPIGCRVVSARNHRRAQPKGRARPRLSKSNPAARAFRLTEGLPLRGEHQPANLVLYQKKKAPRQGHRNIGLDAGRDLTLNYVLPRDMQNISHSTQRRKPPDQTSGGTPCRVRRPVVQRSGSRAFNSKKRVQFPPGRPNQQTYRIATPVIGAQCGAGAETSTVLRLRGHIGQVTSLECACGTPRLNNADQGTETIPGAIPIQHAESA